MELDIFFLLQGGEFQRPWKRCSIIAKCVLEVEIAMGPPVPISVSRTHFALRYEVPKFLPRGGAFMYSSKSVSTERVAWKY